MSLSFGQVIPVTGPNLGFPGNISRFGDRVVKARPFAPLTSTNNLNFGDPAVLIPTTTGGAWTSVADFIATVANIGKLAKQFAGLAVRNVKTSLTYPAGVTPGTNQVGYYSNGQEAELLLRGSGTILLTVGAPSAGDQVYARVVSSATSAVLGAWETNPAALDQFTLATTGASAVGQAVITMSTLTNVQVGQVVSGHAGIPANAYVVSIQAGTSVTINANLTAAIPSGDLVQFSNLAPLNGAEVTSGVVDANSMVEITLTVRNVA